MMKSATILLSILGVASAFPAPSTAFTRKTSTQLKESFGLNDISLDIYDAQPDFLKGEAEYKQWMNKINDDNMLNRKVSRRKLSDCGVCLSLFLWFSIR